MLRSGLFILGVLGMGVTAAVPARAAFWPDNYGWRVDALGGAYLAVEDETTDLNLLNLENSSGLAFLEHVHRLDFLYGCLEKGSRSAWPDSHSFFLESNGEYASFILWPDEYSVIQLSPFRGAYRLNSNLALSASVFFSSGGEGAVSGNAGLGWIIPELLAKDAVTTLGLNAGYRNEYPDLLLQTLYDQDDDYYEGSTIFASLQALNRRGDWTYGLLADYRRVETDERYGIIYQHDLLGFAPVLKGRVALGDGADMLVGFHYSTLGSRQVQYRIVTDHVTGDGMYHIFRQDAAVGLGFQFLDRRLQVATQAAYTAEHCDQSLQVVELEARGGMEYRLSEVWAVRGGYAWTRRDVVYSGYGDVDEQTATIGLGIRPLYELSFDLLGKYFLQDYREPRRPDDEEISIALGVTIRLE